MSKKKKTNKDLRIFGLTMTVAFAVLGLIFIWRDFPGWIVLFCISGFFLLTGLALPIILRPIEWLWMKIAHVIGIVMTYVLLTLTYYIIITPIGLLMRLFGHDPMKRKFDKNAESYWSDVDPEGPTSRPEKPY
jgi:hypothetical protein